MRRRGATLLVGAVVVVILIVASFVGVRVPYVALAPGPTWDTLGTDHNKDVIQVTGGPASRSGGQLRMVTVGVEDQLTLWDALRGWLSGDDAVVPREVIYPPNESQQQVDKENAQEFKASQDAAIVSALRALGYPVHVVVKEVDNGLPAAGRLEKGDQITTVDGQAVTSAEKLGALIGAKAKGSTVRIGYLRHDPAEDARGPAGWRHGVPRAGEQLRRGRGQRGTRTGNGEDRHARRCAECAGHAAWRRDADAVRGEVIVPWAAASHRRPR